MAYLDEEMGPDPFWTDEMLLAYRLFVTNNPGDEDRAMSALGFDPEQRDTGISQRRLDQQRRDRLRAGEEEEKKEEEEEPEEVNGQEKPPPNGTTWKRPDDADPSVSDAIYKMIEEGREGWERQLRAGAEAQGASYDGYTIEDMLRQIKTQGNEGVHPQVWLDAAFARYKANATNIPGGGRGPDDGPGPSGGPTGGFSGGPGPWSGPSYGGGPSGVQSLMGPWTRSAPPTPTMGSASFDPYAAPTPYTPPLPYQPGIYEAPIYTPQTPFAAPTGAQLTADPGYQFRLQQGQDALERSGAARGVTNTGGTMKNILDYGQQAASQEYGNVYNRAANTWGMNEAARQASFGLNAPQQFQAWGATEAGRLGAYQMGEEDRASAYAQNEANRAAAAQFNQLGYQQSWQNEAQRRQQDYANRYRQWTDQYNQWRQQGTDRFNEQFMLANA